LYKSEENKKGQTLASTLQSKKYLRKNLQTSKIKVYLKSIKNKSSARESINIKLVEDQGVTGTLKNSKLTDIFPYASMSTVRKVEIFHCFPMP